ncbi:MAG: hypothetical protein ACXVQ6_07395 [Actinomycetota bacterium]
MARDSDEAKNKGSLRFAELDKLSSRELHDRAVHLAEHRLDIRFFWDLMKALPAAEAMIGNIGEADLDIHKASSLVADAFSSGEGELEDAMRPLYIDYLMKHEKEPRTNE